MGCAQNGDFPAQPIYDLPKNSINLLRPGFKLIPCFRLSLQLHVVSYFKQVLKALFMCFCLVTLGRIAFSKTHTQFKARVQNHTLFEFKIAPF